jgi:hypothetical protein
MHSRAERKAESMKSGAVRSGEQNRCKAESRTDTERRKQNRCRAERRAEQMKIGGESRIDTDQSGEQNRSRAERSGSRIDTEQSGKQTRCRAEGSEEQK